jgi:dTDP-4-dehydrorhamnose reductase
LRTSWVFSSRGKNFLKTIIRLAQERDQLGVVSDQFGAPTSAELVAAITTHVVKNVLADKIETGIYHLTAAGETTWHGIARHILKRADSNGFSLKLKHDRIAAISTRDYPLPAVRPHNSVLDTTDLSQALNLHFPHWESDVSRIADELLGQLHAE